MTQTTSRFFDELAKLVTDAAGAAQGVRQELETIVRGQAERILNEFDLVQREDFDAVKAMARKAREENARLEKRLVALEAELSRRGSASAVRSRASRPVHRTRPKPRI